MVGAVGEVHAKEARDQLTEDHWPGHSLVFHLNCAQNLGSRFPPGLTASGDRRFEQTADAIGSRPIEFTVCGADLLGALAYRLAKVPGQG